MTAEETLQGWCKTNGGTGTHFRKTHYVAQIVGEDEEYNFDREFISYQLSSSYSGKRGKKAIDVDDLVEEGVYEIRYDSWNNKKRRLVQIESIERTDDSISIETTVLTQEEAVAIVTDGKSIERAELRKKIQNYLSDFEKDELQQVSEYVQSLA